MARTFDEVRSAHARRHSLTGAACRMMTQAIQNTHVMLKNDYGYEGQDHDAGKPVLMLAGVPGLVSNRSIYDGGFPLGDVLVAALDAGAAVELVVRPVHLPEFPFLLTFVGESENPTRVSGVISFKGRDHDFNHDNHNALVGDLVDFITESMYLDVQ